MTCDDGTLPENSPALRWTQLLVESSTKIGCPLDSPNNYKQLLTGAGFTNIVLTEYKWPMNSWPKDPKYKELGVWVYENIQQGLQALSLALFTKALGWTLQEVEVFLMEVRKDMKDKTKHGYWKL